MCVCGRWLMRTRYRTCSDVLYAKLYKYCHPQTDFVVSQLFIVARHVGR